MIIRMRLFKRKYLETNPFIGKQLKFKKAHPVFLSVEQIKKIFDVIDNPDFLNLVKFYIYTGARRNEISKLNWKDIDLKNKLIYLNERKSNDYSAIPISNALEKVILSMKKAVACIGKGFPHWQPDTIRHYFLRVRI